MTATEGDVLTHTATDLFIYLEFYVAFNTVQVISRWVVGRAEETSKYSLLGFCIVNCRPTASNYHLSHLRPGGDRTPASEVGGESVNTLAPWPLPPAAITAYCSKPLQLICVFEISCDGTWCVIVCNCVMVCNCQ